MKTKKFLFVNKNVESGYLTNSRNDQWIDIQKHVQTGLKRPRKSRATKAVIKTTLVDHNALCDSTVRSMSCKFDPFSSASVEIDDTVRGLLHYYIYDYHPTIWTYNPKTLRCKPYVFRDSVVKVVNTTIHDSLAMYSLLASATSRIQHIDNRSFPSATLREHSFMCEALQLMQKRIHKSTLDQAAIEQLVLCIMFLGSAEAYRENLPAARIHLQTALKLLEPGGVMSLRDKNLQGQLLMSDLFLACVHMEPCLITDNYDPGPASTLNLAEDELLPLDSPTHGKIILQKDDTILPTPLRHLISSIVETDRINSQLDVTSMTPERAFQTTHWVTKRNMSIRSKILSTPTSNPRIHALRTAVVMWTLMAMNITGRVKTVKMMAWRNLIPALQEFSEASRFAYEDVLLWILFVGYCCAREGSAEMGWFGERILQRKKWLCLSEPTSDLDGTVLEIEAFLQGFLYSRPVQRSRILVIARQLQTAAFSEYSFEVVQR